jgi:hypothetical protein
MGDESSSPRVKAKCLLDDMTRSGETADQIRSLIQCGPTAEASIRRFREEILLAFEALLWQRTHKTPRHGCGVRSVCDHLATLVLLSEKGAV